MKTSLLLSAMAVVGMTACASAPMSSAPAFSQANLPDAVKVPAGHKVSMETVGVGASPMSAEKRQRWLGVMNGYSLGLSPY